MPLPHLSLRNIRRSLPLAPPARDSWAPAIGKVIGELEDLIRSSEREFLAVGEKLIEFRASARLISSHLSALTGLISGEQGRSAAAALDRVLECSRRLHGHLEETCQSLARIQEEGRRLREAFVGLPAMVSTLRALCTLTHIETARLGAVSEGFTDLAEEVRPLSESVQLAGQTVLEAASSLECGVQPVLRTATGVRSRQLRDLPHLVDMAAAGLKDFAAQQELAADTSARQAASYETLCAGVDDLVHSIQFHDIIRQQIEHVVEALRGLATSRAPARSVLALQCSQLRAAARTFATAVEDIENNLQTVGAGLAAMAEGGASVLGMKEHGSGSFFQRMEGCFAAILSVLADCTGADAKVRAHSGAIEALVERTRASIADIRGIEIRVQRIALNASIRAAHIGGGGEPLGVIADLMQSTVSASSEKSEAASRASDAIGRAAHGLADAEAIPAGAAEACLQLQTCNLEMLAASESAGNRALEITEVAGRLLDRIGELRGGLSAAGRFATLVHGACEQMERIAATLPAGGDAGLPDVEALAGRYTMQTEREIHHAVLNGAAAPGTPQDALGENVELF